MSVAATNTRGIARISHRKRLRLPSRIPGGAGSGSSGLHNELERFCGNAAVPVFAFDAEGRRIFSNTAFDELVGYDGREFLGKRAPFPWNVGDPLVRLDWVLSGEPVELGVRVTGAEFRHRSGRSIRSLLTGTAIYTEKKELAAYVVFVTPAPTAGRSSRVLPAPLKIQLSCLGEELSRYLEAPNRIGQALSRLSPREREVADHMRDGWSAKRIAHDLHISEHTIRNHVKAIYRKLGVHSHLELMRGLPG